jgi:2-dehydropantoate 2-reductase
MNTDEAILSTVFENKKKYKDRNMKILMFGRGVISTQYAWGLEKAGHNVEFYVRPGRKAEYGPTVTLNVYDARKSIRGKLIQEVWPIKMIEDIPADHDYDLIFVSVQHYHFKKVAEVLTDKIGKATILIFNNFWEEPIEQVTNLPAEQLVWGFPMAGGGFDSKGELNGTILGSITIGTFGTETTERANVVMDLFKSAGIKSKVIKDFRSYLFSHFIFNAAMHLETFKYGKSFNLDALQTTKYWKNVIANGKELLPLLKARNVDVKASSELKMFSLPPWLMSLVMKFVIRFLPSLKHLFTGHSNYNELKSYCEDVLSKAEELKINLPTYEANKELYL